jgi:hypothetical protein
MTVADLIKQLQNHDPNKRVVVSDTDGAGAKAADIEFVDQRVERGVNVITIWVHV